MVYTHIILHIIVLCNTIIIMNSLAKPTEQAYEELQLAYDWFNQRLFDGVLPPCLITFQRNKRTMGYFSKERFVDQSGKKTDEIALNPEYFAVIPLDELLSTLVHEWADKMMAVGLCPSDTGQPGGKQTGDQMMDYILENGRFRHECDALIETKFKISWYDRFPAPMPSLKLNGEMKIHFVSGDQTMSDTGYKEPIPALSNPHLELIAKQENASNRNKFKCNKCDAQAWGKPSLNLVCGDCCVPMQAS